MGESTMKIFFSLICFVFISITTCFGGQFPLSDTEFLNYELPSGFEFKTSRDPDDQFRFALNFSHFGQSPFRDLGSKVFLFKATEEDLDSLKTDQQKRDFLAVDCEYFERGSVERKTKIQKFKGESDVFYCSFTDESLVDQENLLPGQFRHVTVALVINNKFEFLARAYSNSVENNTFKDFLKIMSTLNVTEK
jgi:hypothetical protein